MERISQQSVLAWLRLIRVHQKISHAATSQVRDRGLSLAQFDLLAQLRSAEGMTQQELADRLLVTKGNICQLLDRLEHQQLLSRQPDGRTNRIYLTDKGRRILAGILPEHEAVIAAQFAGLSQEEQGQLLALLRKLDRTLD